MTYLQDLRLRQLHLATAAQAGMLCSVAEASHGLNSFAVFKASHLRLQELRAAIIALRCFNVETGLVGENVKETGLLPIRMQWWKDAVNSIYREQPVKHPAIQALAEVQHL